jgi:diguanylate cyclase (GGDEF)-like protein/PAS domain S-box-containing protein
LLALPAGHDYSLLMATCIACWLTSLALIGLFKRAQATIDESRASWIVTAAFTTGTGLWATHLIAVSIYYSNLPLGYHPARTALSLLVVMVLTAAGIRIAVQGAASWRAPVGGAILGAGAAYLHYLGMWALELPGRVTWSLGLVALSLALAALFGAAALLLAIRRDTLNATLAAATLFALGIVAHHVTAWTAVEIVADPSTVVAGLTVPHQSLAYATAGAAIALLGMCVVGIFADRSSQQKIKDQYLLLEAALSYMAQGLCMFDPAGRLVLWNSRFEEIYGHQGRLRVGMSLRDILLGAAATGAFSGDPDEYTNRAMAATQAGETFRHVVELADGREIAISNEVRPNGGWVSTHQDITDQRRAEKELSRTRAFLDTIIENVPATIVVKQLPDFRYVLINRAGEKHFAIPREDMLGKNSADVFAPAVASIILEHDQRLANTGIAEFHDEHAVDTPGKGTLIVTTNRIPMLGDDGKIHYILTVINDLTERKKAEARIEHMAHHDPLTNLPNRAAFNERLESTMARATVAGDRFAVLCIDLDRFKEVNDVFGHSTGDALLCEVAERLKRACEGAFLSRIGGDEFTIISPAETPVAAEATARRLLTTVEGDIEIAGHPLRTGLTIGVALFPDDGTDPTTLLANADAALYRAKSDARGSLCFFAPDMDERLRAKRALQHDLRKAIANEELEVHYQPQASISGEILGFEALVRWRHPSGKQIPPAMFIPLAEESGLIISLGEWILREACREAASWRKPLQIAINLSPVQFQHGDLAGLVHSVLMETGLKPSRLELEITEGVLIGDFARAVSILRRLKGFGARIAMDDFGTGYSSLSYLQSFPFDKIKIDRAFISNLEQSPQSGAIVRAVIGLGRGLDLPVVAEGVETEAQMAFLTREACEEVQGYLIGRPAPIGDYADIVGRAPSQQAKTLAG